MKKILTSVIMLTLILTIITSCAPKPAEEAEVTPEETTAEETTPEATPTEEEKEPVTAAFWTLPDPELQAYWQDLADAFMAENPNITIEVAPLVDDPSSEENLLLAMAGGTAPAAAGGTFTGFAAQLAEEGAIIPLEELPGWDEVVKAHNMEQSMKVWQFPDGHYYIIPIYTNPILFAWNLDLLEELGFDKAPETYSEVMEVAKALKEKYPEKFLAAGKHLGKASWYYSWWYFFPFYNTASQGKPFVTGSDLTADENAINEVFKFFSDAAANDYLMPEEADDPFPTGTCIWTWLGPWDIPRWTETYPDFKYGENYVLTGPPKPDDVTGDPITFADSKGYIILADSTEEEQLAVWEFLKWTLSNPDNDLKWFETTGMLTVRDDLSTNSAFEEFFKANPALVDYANMVPNSIPPLMHAKCIDMYTSIMEKGMVPIVREETTPEDAWSEIKADVEAILAE